MVPGGHAASYIGASGPTNETIKLMKKNLLSEISLQNLTSRIR
jgi:hypothetical protein